MNNRLKNAARLLVSWRFLVNLVIILIVTSWIPLMSRTIVVRDDNNTVIQEVTITARLYESWWTMIRLAPGARHHARGVLWHVGICFVISFTVWYATLGAGKQQPQDDNDDPPPEPDNDGNNNDKASEHAHE